MSRFLGCRIGLPVAKIFCGRYLRMSPEDEKTFKIMLASFEYDFIERIIEVIQDTVTNAFEKRLADEAARRREMAW